MGFISSRLTKLAGISIALFFIGLATWLIMLGIGQPAWGILISDYLYFAGITQGALAIAVILRITSAGWSAKFFRLAAALALSFFPIGIGMLMAIFAARNHIFYWYDGSHDNFWYNPFFFFIRTFVPFLVFYTLARRLLRRSTSTEAVATHRDTDPAGSLNNRLLVTGFFLLLSFVFYQTMIAWDFSMLLNKHFADTAYSVVFGVSSVLGGIALLIVIMSLSMNFLGTTAFSSEQIRNMAQLMLGITILWFYIWYTQFFNIWFVNLPEETEPIYLRIFHGYGGVFGFSIFFAAVIPFFSLIFKKVRESRLAVTVIACSILLGLWLDRYLMAVPALAKDGKIADIPLLHPVNILFTAGILGAIIFVFTRLVGTHGSIVPQTEEEVEDDPLIAHVTGWQ